MKQELQRFKRWVEENWLNVAIGVFITLLAMPCIFDAQENQARENKKEIMEILQEEKVYIPPMELVPTPQPISEPEEVATGFLKTVASSPKEEETKPKEEKKKKKKKGFPELAEEEYLLAQIIHKEAAPTKEDRSYVGSVVINRCRTQYKDFRQVNTIKEVLYQNYGEKDQQQYATVTVKAVEAGVKPSKQDLKVARGLLSGEIPCLEEKILYQTATKQAWMVGKVGDANLPNAGEYYGYPLDYEEKCK